jgi:hypothetical protein
VSKGIDLKHYLKKLTGIENLKPDNGNGYGIA